MFEGYSMQGVHAIPNDSSAFAFRSENIISAPLIKYLPADSDLYTQAAPIWAINFVKFFGMARARTIYGPMSTKPIVRAGVKAVKAVCIHRRRSMTPLAS